MSEKTKTATFTPGPWFSHFEGPAPEVRADTDVPVVGWQGFDDADRDIGEHQANARLIAAAPELLEACKKALTCAGIDTSVRELIQSAIARATGDIAF